jgi:DNA-binding response OmpR family regulator
VAAQTATILIVEDDLDVAEMLSAYFQVQGYQTLTANWGADALETAESKTPDIILLDIRLPDFDGFEVAGRLRAGRKTQHIPIIFLTDQRASEHRLQGLEIGGDDYVTKPFDIQELRLRVRNTLQRAQQSGGRNPVTSLPEGAAVDQQLERLLSTKDWGLLLVEIHHLGAFRASYGFVASDDAARAVIIMVQNILHELDIKEKFIGQLAPDQIVLVVAAIQAASLSATLSERIPPSLDYFYPLKDRDAAAASTTRLGLTLRTLTHDDGPFEGLDPLKAALLATGGG